MAHCQRSFGGVIAGQSWSAYLDRDCNRVEKSNVQYSKRNLALGGPHSGQVWVVGSAGIRYFEERVCFTISCPAANFQLPQTPLEMIRRCLAGSRPLPTPLSAGERVFSELFETSELEQFKRNIEEELRPIDEVTPPESLWFLK